MTETPMQAIEAYQANRRLRAAMIRLLDELRDWVHIYPRDDDVELPEHDVAFVSNPNGGGPENVIHQAIAESPDLWAHAIPPECCIVRRDQLTGLIPSLTIDALASYGAAAVENQAARIRYEREDRERRER